MLQRIAALLRVNPPVVDNRGILWGSGAGYPTLGSDGYQIGCIWCNTTGAAGTSLYVNEGSVTSCDFVAVDTTAGASAGAINFDDNVTGPLISIETAEPTNNSYTTPFLITGTYSSTCALALQLSATNQRPVSFLFDDGGEVLGAGNYRGVLSRVLLCSTQTGQIALRAIRGQVKVKDGLTLNIGANEFNLISGIEGYMELAGTTARTIGVNTRVAALAALLEINQDITLNAGGKCVGVLVQLAQTTAKTVGGIGTCGVAVGRVDSDHATHQALWGTGFVTGDGDCTTGMLIGTAVTGISVGNCSTAGITVESDDDKVAGYNAIYAHIDTGGATGWNAGRVTASRFKVTLDGTGNVGNVSAIWGGLNSGGTYTGLGQATCAAFEVVTTHVGAHPTSILYLTSAPGAGASHATMPYLVFAENPTGTGSNILFEVGSAPAGYTCTTGTGTLFHLQTLQIKVNAAAKYLSLSSVENSLTMIHSDDKVAGCNGVYVHIDTGGATGWAAGRVTASRFKVTLDGTGNVGNVSAIWGGLNSGGTYTGLGQATCAAFEVVTTHVGSHPTAILYLTSAPGTSASHATMPYLVFAENPTGTGSNILFEVGSAPAGYTCTTGAGTLYHAETLQIKVNGNARYLPMSTAQTSFTTAYQIILTTTDPATATNGIYSNLVETATWTGSITPLRCRNTITTAAAGGNCYGGWFNMLFDSGAAPTGLGLSCGLYVEAGSNVASTGVSSVLMATLLGDADGGVTASPILTLADASTLKTAVVMEFGFNAGGTLLGTAADSTAVAFRTGGNAATNIEFKQGLRVMCNGAYYYIGLIAQGDWKDD